MVEGVAVDGLTLGRVGDKMAGAIVDGAALANEVDGATVGDVVLGK